MTKVQYLLCFVLLMGGKLHAQCANNLATMVHDTVLAGVGYGTYQIDVPKFPLDSGLLVSVTVNAKVSLQYAFSMKNADVAASVYTLKVGREDQYSSPAMNHVYDRQLENQVGVYSMSPGQVVTQPAFALLTGQDNKDSITGNVTPFQGPGTVHFTYSPVTWTTLHTNNNSSYNYSASASDLTHFSVSYLYCRSGGVLSEGVMSFTAQLQGAASVALQWSAVLEQPSYILERSTDGKVFVQVATVSTSSPGSALEGSPGSSVPGSPVPGSGDLSYLDQPPAAGTYYYRLRVGTLYSPIRQVVLSPAAWVVYPNPAYSRDEVRLTLPNRGGWQIDLVAADGRSIQSELFHGRSEVPISFTSRLAAGIYYIRAREIATGRMVCKPLSIK